MNKLVLINNTSTVDSGDASITDFTDVPDEQIAAFDADDIKAGTQDLTSSFSGDRVILVQGNGDYPVATMAFDVSDVKRVVTKAFQAYTQQVTNLGFTGSGSNDLSYSADSEEYVKLTRLEKGFEQFPRATATVSIGSNDESYDVASAIAEDINAKEDAKSFVRADVLVNDSSSQLQDDSAASVTLDVTEGSTIVIANVTSGDDVVATTSDYLRIGGATGLTNPVYGIENIESNDGAETTLEITLDRPYGGVDSTGEDAGTLDAGISGNEAGVEFAAKSHTDIDDFEESFTAVSFQTALSDGLADSHLAISTTPETGSGTFEQVRQYETIAAGIRSGYYYRNYFPQEPEYFADDSTSYDIETVVVELDNDNAVVNQNRYLEIVTAWDTGAGIGTSLETFFG